MTAPAPPSALQTVLDRMARAARAAGRDPHDVALVAVTKQQPWATIEPILGAGQKRFGENRVQEAQTRWAEHAEGLELRLIGPLQTNKVRDALDLFAVIETLDRPRLARAIAAEIQRRGAAPSLYVEVNTGEEPQKAGVSPAAADAFIQICRDEFGLEVDGLMCVPPFDEEPAMHFALLAKIARRNGLDKLSMGMSADFETAIAFGATSVRVGQALFGARSG
jgi:pyridoxal phosphate enzyme (YggS family)